MTTFQTLYLQAPFWVWLAAAACFLAANLASGRGELIWPAIAAVVVSMLKLLGLRVGLALDLPLFVALSGAGIWYGRKLPAPKPAKSPAQPDPTPEPEAPPVRVGSREHSAMLIGRIARTTGRFANGVGRVWIDGVEWAAELGGGEDDLAPDTPVRVLRVIGAVKLQVGVLN